MPHGSSVAEAASVNDPRIREVVDGKFQCAVCQKYFRDLKYVHRHLLKAHADDVAAALEQSPPPAATAIAAVLASTDAATTDSPPVVLADASRVDSTRTARSGIPSFGVNEGGDCGLREILVGGDPPLAERASAEVLVAVAAAPGLGGDPVCSELHVQQIAGGKCLCTLCGQYFRGLEKVIKHLRKEHPEATADTPSTAPNPGEEPRASSEQLPPCTADMASPVVRPCMAPFHPDDLAPLTPQAKAGAEVTSPSIEKTIHHPPVTHGTSFDATEMHAPKREDTSVDSADASLAPRTEQGHIACEKLDPEPLNRQAEDDKLAAVETHNGPTLSLPDATVSSRALEGLSYTGQASSLFELSDACNDKFVDVHAPKHTIQTADAVKVSETCTENQVDVRAPDHAEQSAVTFEFSALTHAASAAACPVETSVDTGGSAELPCLVADTHTALGDCDLQTVHQSPIPAAAPDSAPMSASIPVAGQVPGLGVVSSSIADGNILQLADGLFRCALCSKHFRGSEYVRKHLRKVHGHRESSFQPKDQAPPIDAARQHIDEHEAALTPKPSHRALDSADAASQPAISRRALEQTCVEAPAAPEAKIARLAEPDAPSQLMLVRNVSEWSDIEALVTAEPGFVHPATAGVACWPVRTKADLEQSGTEAHGRADPKPATPSAGPSTSAVIRGLPPPPPPPPPFVHASNARPSPLPLPMPPPPPPPSPGKQRPPSQQEVDWPHRRPRISRWDEVAPPMSPRRFNASPLTPPQCLLQSPHRRRSRSPPRRRSRSPVRRRHYLGDGGAAAAAWRVCGGAEAAREVRVAPLVSEVFGEDTVSSVGEALAVSSVSAEENAKAALRRVDAHVIGTQVRARRFLEEARGGRYDGLSLRMISGTAGRSRFFRHLEAPHFAYDPDEGTLVFATSQARMNVWSVLDVVEAFGGLHALSAVKADVFELRAQFNSSARAREVLDELTVLEVHASVIPSLSKLPLAASVAPMEAARPARIAEDAARAAQVIRRLDALVGVPAATTAALLALSGKHLLSATSGGSSATVGAELDEEGKLDLRLLYLRRAHFFCLYAVEWCDDEWDLRRRCGATCLRPAAPPPSVAMNAEAARLAAAHRRKLEEFLQAARLARPAAAPSIATPLPPLATMATDSVGCQ